MTETRRFLPFAGLVLGAALLIGCASHTPLPTCATAGGVTPVCGFQNPEDLVDLGNGWLLISQMTRGEAAGSLLAFHPDEGLRVRLWPSDDAAPTAETAASCAAPDAATFAPHGIDLSHDGRTLLVVNHGGRESVERFRIGYRGSAPSLTWMDCIAFDAEILLNDVAALPDQGFVVTQMMSQSSLAPLSLVLGRDTGRVWQWSREQGIRPVAGSEGNGPNGVAASPDGETLFVAEWGAERLVRVGRDGSDRASVSLGFHPDNLSWAGPGQLLVAGQIAGPIEATGCFDLPEGGCALASAVALVDAETFAVRRLWTHDPATAAGGISSALKRGDTLWLGAFGGDRIARISMP